MTDTRPNGPTYTLWGGALSLYSGKVRSYLIKKGLPYREFYASHPDFNARIRPIVGLGVTPVVETPEGDVLQDSTEIIAALEARLPEHPMIPATPVQRLVATLLDAYATEHLLLAAMHYRWGEPHVSAQRDFLVAEFGRASYIGVDRNERNAAGARMMAYFSATLPNLGGSPETAPAIEAEYLELLELLDQHFQHVPYLLGGHPSIADFGFMAPLFAHLGRDPAPASIMALRAPNVMRWKERMNLAVIEDAEYPSIPASYPADDAIPPTLLPILKLIFSDWTPELKANTECFNAWVRANPDKEPGQLVCQDGKRRVHPTIGPIAYAWRNVAMRRASAPQTLWHFSQALDQARALNGIARARFDELIAHVEGQDAMAITLKRPIVRRNHVLVLGDETPMQAAPGKPT